MRNAIGTLVAGALAGGWLISAAHAAETGGFEVISDLERFEATFVGPKISDPADDANYFVISTDGTLEGNWHGAVLTGDWRWEDGFFCRTLIAPRAAPEDCQEWSVAGDRARLVRNRGTGDETLYAIRD